MGKLWDPGERYYSRVYKNRRRWPQEKKKPIARGPKILYQLGASLIIFLFIWGIFQFDGPLMTSVQNRVRIWFTEDYSIEPVLKFFSDVGLWGDTLERAGYDAATGEKRIPLTVPVSGQITRPYGWVLESGSPQTFHDGILIAAPLGTPIRAAQDGKVTRIANEEELGRLVEVTGDDGLTTVYAHCNEILVNLEDRVNAGQVIAKVGKTGKADQAQLFFKITNGVESLNPTDFFLPAEQKT